MDWRCSNLWWWYPMAELTRRCHSAGSDWPGLMLGQGDPFHALWDPATRRRRRRGVTNDPVRRPEGERPGPGAYSSSSSSDSVCVSRSLSLSHSLLSSSIRARIPSQRILHRLRFPTISPSPLVLLWRAANGNFTANKQRVGPIHSIWLPGSTRKCKLTHFLTLELSIRRLAENCRGFR